MYMLPVTEFEDTNSTPVGRDNAQFIQHTNDNRMGIVILLRGGGHYVIEDSEDGN